MSKSYKLEGASGYRCSGFIKTDRHRIVAEAEGLLRDERAYSTMARAGSPFSDGRSAERIVKIFCPGYDSNGKQH